MVADTQTLIEQRPTSANLRGIDRIPDVQRTTWTVLQVKSRQEKALSQDLRRHGIDHYLPLIRQSKIYGGRRFNVELPLFAGYLFIYGSIDEIYTADRTRRVSKIIEVFNQQQIEDELQQLRLALETSVSLTAYPYLKAGVQVEVRSGPFRGLRGMIEHWSRADRLILQIETLGQAVSLEIGPADLEVVQ